MVEWNPLFKAPYNVQQSTINSGWKQVATALTLFDSRKRWRLDVACAMHTGPSWVLKGRLNESHYTFCKPAFFSSLLSCATTSNNQDKGHLPLWTPFSHSGTSSWIVYRYRSHGSCCTKHKGWLQTSFPFLHRRCCSPLPWHQLLRCQLQGFSVCWNLSAFFLAFLLMSSLCGPTAITGLQAILDSLWRKHDDFVAVKMCHSPNPTPLGFMHMQAHCFPVSCDIFASRAVIRPERAE